MRSKPLPVKSPSLGSLSLNVGEYAHVQTQLKTHTSASTQTHFKLSPCIYQTLPGFFTSRRALSQLSGFNFFTFGFLHGPFLETSDVGVRSGVQPIDMDV